MIRAALALHEATGENLISSARFSKMRSTHITPIPIPAVIGPPTTHLTCCFDRILLATTQRLI